MLIINQIIEEETMSDQIKELEIERAALHEDLARIDIFRRGTISRN